MVTKQETLLSYENMTFIAIQYIIDVIKSS